MRMKLSIAVAMAHHPKLLILDVNCSTRLGSIYSVLSKKEEINGNTKHRKRIEMCIA